MYKIYKLCKIEIFLICIRKKKESIIHRFIFILYNVLEYYFIIMSFAHLNFISMLFF